MAVIAKDQVVSFHYTLRDKEGTVIDASDPQEPLSYLHGHQNIVPGLESQLDSKQPGDKLQVHVTPELGYGDYDEEKCFLISRRQFPQGQAPEVGMMLELHSDEGHVMRARVARVGKEEIELDANHPLAGVDLFFDVEIVGVRAATSEEIAHGHVHSGGCGGH